MAIIDHFGQTPASITAAIVSDLETYLKMSSGSGVVRTIRVIPSVDADEHIDQSLRSGTPALLVAYEGGSFNQQRSNRKLFDQTVNISVICVATQQDSVSLRLANDPTIKAGVLDLLDLATYYILRTLTSLSGLRSEKVLNHRIVAADANRYIALAEFSAVRSFDAWEDDPSTTLDDIGIVWSPTDYDDLWEGDNETPKSDWPPTSSGGAYTL